MGINIPEKNNNSNPLGGGSTSNSTNINYTDNSMPSAPTPSMTPTPSSTPATTGGLNLVKGQKLNLTKTAPHLSEVKVGLGWDINNAPGASFDLDAQVILLGENGKARSQKDLIFFNNLKSTCGSVIHQGDNQTGAGEGDDEVINIYLNQVPAEVQKIVFMATIHDAIQKGQNFGQVSNAYIRLIDNSTGQQLAKFDLSEDYSTYISIVLGELYKHNGEWKFNAIGQGKTEDLEGMCRAFGVL